jgi:hypothetical protein
MERWHLILVIASVLVEQHVLKPEEREKGVYLKGSSILSHLGMSSVGLLAHACNFFKTHLFNLYVTLSRVPNFVAHAHMATCCSHNNGSDDQS